MQTVKGISNREIEEIIDGIQAEEHEELDFEQLRFLRLVTKIHMLVGIRALYRAARLKHYKAWVAVHAERKDQPDNEELHNIGFHHFQTWTNILQWDSALEKRLKYLKGRYIKLYGHITGKRIPPVRKIIGRRSSTLVLLRGFKVLDQQSPD